MRAQGISLPSPKAVQAQAAQAGKDAKKAVESAISSVLPAEAPKPPKAIGVQLRNPLAPLSAAAAGGQPCRAAPCLLVPQAVLHAGVAEFPVMPGLQLPRPASSEQAPPLRLLQRPPSALPSPPGCHRTRPRYCTAAS
jgi:hypothetical protein